MANYNKKGFVQLVFNPVVLVVILILGLVGVYYLSGGKGLSILGDTKSQLKSEYTTLWGGATDGTSSFTSSGNVFIAYDAISIAGLDKNSRGSIVFNQKFKGQEIAVLIGEGVALNGVEGLGVSCYSQSGQNFCKEYATLLFKPHTLEPAKWDLFRDGEFVKEIQADSSGFLTLSFSNYYNGYTFTSGYLHYVGYKAQFECNLASDEVWIQESFAQPFSINDLSFPVTKLCKATRPFVLRDIQQGEQAWYPDPIPDFNRGLMINVPDGNIAVVNYATPNVAGVTNPCDNDQANIKVAGKWICTQVIKTTTITREIIIREIIPITEANSFTFNTHKDKPSFKIGSNTFSTSHLFTCSFPSEVDVVHPPEPSSDCYKSVVSYDGKTYEMQDKQLQGLNSNIAVQYFASGEVRRTENKLVGTYIFNVVNPLDISLNGGLTFKQNEPSKVSIKITNNLPENDIILKISQKVVRTNQNLIEEEDKIIVPTGSIDYDFDVVTSNLGVNEIVVQAFYPIEADASVLLPSEKIRINVEISGEQPSIVKFVEVEKETTTTIKENPISSFFSRIIAWIKNIFK